MKRVTFLSWALRSAAFTLLGNMVVPVPAAWAADEVQVLRREPATNSGVMSFTTFQQETQAIIQNLPCKWISKDGRLGPSYGNARYDFLCKGGDFATISLYLDKADMVGNSVAKARLLYRDWPVSANPNAADAVTAQQFVQHVAGRFVPAAVAGEVMDAFWGQKPRKWSMNGVEVQFSIDHGAQFSVRRLEITGTSGTLSAQVVPLYPVVTPTDAGLTKPDVQAPMFIGNPAPEPVAEKMLPGVSITTPMPPRVPTDAGLTKPMPIPVTTQTEINVLPQQPAGVTLPVAPAPVVTQPAVPQGPAPAPDITVKTPGVLPLPGMGADRTGGMLVVPKNAPASAPDVSGEAAPLQAATPAELNTAPAPESKVVPVAPPELSSTLVPSNADLKTGATRAPSNFDAYNRAVELTKDVEQRAQTTRVEQAKVTASKPVAKPKAETTTVPQSAVVPPALKPLPVTPQDAAPATPKGEGLGVTNPPQVPLEDIGQSPNYNGPRSTDPRPLPQLKFVPKAEPLQNGADQVIQFEDEKSKL